MGNQLKITIEFSLINCSIHFSGGSAPSIDRAAPLLFPAAAAAAAATATTSPPASGRHLTPCITAVFPRKIDEI